MNATALTITAAPATPEALPALLGPFLDPLAIAIVVGGTLGAVVLRNSWGDIGRSLSALRVLGRKQFSVEPLLEQIAALTRIGRRHGLVKLDQSVIEDPDIAAAVTAAVDGDAPESVEQLLRARRAARIERHRAAADVWAGAAEVAPAMGMIGTLVGLVRMFTAMSDPAAIGGAMAIALLTTLYGAVLGNMIAMPVAVRLRRRARVEALERARLEAPLVTLAGLEPSRLWDRHQDAAA